MKTKEYYSTVKKAVRAALPALLFFLLAVPVQAAGTASREGADRVSYEVFFVDKDDSSRRILNSQRGSADEGSELIIHFPKRLVGSDGYFWEAISDSPITEHILSPGTQKIYVRFEKKELAAKPEAEGEGAMKLKQWLRAVWEADCEITGRDPATAPSLALVVEDTKGNDSRIKNLVSMINDPNWHYFYLIGKNYRPQTLILGTVFDTEYSSVVMEEFTVGKDNYTVVRAGVKRIWEPGLCAHHWEKSNLRLNDCLNQGRETITCKKCSSEEQILLPALGHIDSDGDSLCDRCKKRAFSQSAGDQIQTVLETPNGPVALNFTCLDDNYLGSGKMLYLADETLGAEITGLCFEEGDAYDQSAVRRYFRLELVNELSIGSALMPIPWQDGMEGIDYAGLLSQDEFEVYKEKISLGEGYFLRTSKTEGTVQAVEKDGTVVTVSAANNRSYGARPFILMERPELSEMAEPYVWSRGDLQLREIGGREYLFRCIDEDYSDSQSTHRSGALFLCERVIRSDIDSDASALRTFSFGSDNNYKNSEVRRWLEDHAADALFQMEPIYTGVNTAYTGSTGAGMFGQMDSSLLKPRAIGFQLLDDRLFCLSVEEAVKYREELWRFGGSPEDNPNTQINPCSGGYYLRTPVYRENESGTFCYTDQIYVVDLYLGNIHPTGTDSTGIGLRPAFVLPQGEGAMAGN